MAPFDFYLIRSPKFPLKVADYLNMSESFEEVTCKLRTIYGNKEVQEALYLASPELHKELMIWIESDGAISQNVAVSLYKYLLRMSSRCTPFGLFSGILLGNISKGSSSLLQLEKTHQHITYDMDYLSKLALSIFADTENINSVVYRPNNSLYKCLDSYRYYEFREIDGKRIPYLMSAGYNPLVEYILTKADAGCSFGDLLSSMVAIELEEDQSRPFLLELIQRQVLVSEMEPNLTGQDYFTSIKRKVKSLEGLPWSSFIDILDNIKQENLSFFERSKKIISLNEKLNISYPTERFFCVDQVYEGENRLNIETVKLISGEIDELSPLYADITSEDFKKFKAKFIKTYDREFVPLLFALDRDFGIGYGKYEQDLSNHELLKELNSFRKSSETHVIAPLDRFVLKKFTMFQNDQKNQIVLDQTDMAELSKLVTPIKTTRPATFYALGNLVCHDHKKMDEGSFYFNLTAISGPSALNLMSRFACAEGDLHDKLKMCADYEQSYYGDSIVAEVVHLPESRVANVLKRPSVRKYEIQLLNCNSSDSTEKILLDDLLIGLKNDKLVLWSRKYRKQVIPRMSTAHNYHSDTTLYRLLCDLQSEDLRYSFKWDWGILENQPHLPRVVYKHLILCRERWIIPSDEWKCMDNIKSSTGRDTFRNRYKLPQKVLLIEGDNELLIDFYCPLSTVILKNKLKKGDIVLNEFLFKNNGSPTRDETGNRYSNEIIIPFRSIKLPEKNTVYPPIESLEITRKFGLGSKWMSFKLYCNSFQSDKILHEYISRLIGRLSDEKLIDEWFFVRYYDPDPHLRIRFKLYTSSANIIGRITSAVHTILNPLIALGTIKNVVFDIYSRELERYGPDMMPTTEYLFYRESEMVLGMLKHLDFENNNRWLLACYGINQLLNTVSFSPHEKFEWASMMYSVFFNEFSEEEKLKYKLDKLYRQKKAELDDFFSGNSNLIAYADLDKLSSQRQGALNSLIKSLKSKLGQQEKSKGKTLPEYLADYSHMLLNRLFSLEQRRYELITYHFLSKYYRTQQVFENNIAVRRY